jgi:hypothetical protein
VEKIAKKTGAVGKNISIESKDNDYYDLED